MNTWQLFLITWSWEPSVLLGCAALTVAYLLAVRSRPSRHAVYFVAGILVLLFSLVSPLDTLGDTYLFSAHMMQHLLMVLIVPPLLLLGIPRWLAEEMLDVPFIGRTERVLGRPWLAWPIGVVTLMVWHIPALYNAVLSPSGATLHVFQHLTFLVSATIFWWPVASPLTERRLTPPQTLFYLLPAGMMSSLLGVVLAFAPQVLYSAYLAPEDTLGILPFLHNSLGVTAKSDQELAGLLMWVPGSCPYLVTALGAFIRWFDAGEREEAALAASLDLAGEQTLSSYHTRRSNVA